MIDFDCSVNRKVFDVPSEMSPILYHEFLLPKPFEAVAREGDKLLEFACTPVSDRNWCANRSMRLVVNQLKVIELKFENRRLLAM